MLVEAAIGEIQCKVWVRKFKNGDFDVSNEQRGRPPKEFENVEF